MTRWGALLLVAAGVACAGTEATTVSLENPRALTVACASPPADITARLWVSGYQEPFALTFDAAAGTTSGTADIAPGVVRKLTIDWYLPLGRADGIDLVLAQAQADLPLVDNVQATAAFTIPAESIMDTSCLDMRKDTFAGAPTVLLDGAAVPVCDLDDSCASGDPVACSNLVESCSGSDPLDRAVEP